MPGEIFIDCTIQLSNRTAVYFMADHLAELAAEVTGRPPLRRYWRLFTRRRLDILDTPRREQLALLAHKLAGREARHLHLPWPRPKAMPGLFVDAVTTPLTRLSSGDLVVVHDLGCFLHPEFYDGDARGHARQVYSRIQAAAPHIVAVSHATLAALTAHFPADYASTTVIHPYTRVRPARVPRAKQKLVFMPGVLERRKNHLAAIEGFRQSGLAAAGWRLLIAGPPGNAAEQVAAAAGAGEGVQYLGYLTGDEVERLYDQAAFTLFPSLFEGFGLPAIEAVARGALPIVSLGTVLEEIVGPDGLLVDPHSPASIAATLRAARDMSEPTRTEQVARIAAHQRAYSPERFDELWRARIAAVRDSFSDREREGDLRALRRPALVLD
ncbi:MAG: glycosyl transferase group 1 [Caulobacteraceae bacterium]|nr:glycosyl transferase group 1 [Caulobacteraceae bacterium]